MTQKTLLIRQDRGKIKYRIKVSDYLYNTLKNVTLTFYAQGMFIHGAYHYTEGWVSTPEAVKHSIRDALYRMAKHVTEHGGALARKEMG